MLLIYILSIKIYTLTFSLTEFSLSAVQQPRRVGRLPNIGFYEIPGGAIIPLISGVDPRIAYDHYYALGVIFNGHLYPMYDRRRQWILVRLDNAQNVPMTGALYNRYGHLFYHPQQHPHNNNVESSPLASRPQSA